MYAGHAAVDKPRQLGTCVPRRCQRHLLLVEHMPRTAVLSHHFNKPGHDCNVLGYPEFSSILSECMQCKADHVPFVRVAVAVEALVFIDKMSCSGL